jgi:DNA-binding NtrC family response regulator
MTVNEEFVPLREMERRYIEQVLREVRGNQRRASRILGITRWSLARRLQKYGLQAGSMQARLPLSEPGAADAGA